MRDLPLPVPPPSSTLDPVLRGEQTGPDWRTFLLLATVGAYLFLPPGVCMAHACMPGHH